MEPETVKVKRLKTGDVVVINKDDYDADPQAYELPPFDSDLAAPPKAPPRKKEK